MKYLSSCLVGLDFESPYLSTRWLGEPQRPFVHQRMLHVEIVRVVEDCDLVVFDVLRLLSATRPRILIGGALASCVGVLVTVGAVGGGDGDGVERDG